MESGSRHSDVDELRWGRLIDWVQLVRLPNAFSVVSNCIVAAVVTVGSIGRLNTIVPLFAVSILAYWAGMILNDVNDIEEDKQHRPNRPIASGRISPALAEHVATALLLIGLAILSMVLLAAQSKSRDWMIYSIVSYVLLWLAIKLYNSSLKLTLLGPFLMGACRSLNVLVIGFALLNTYWAQPFSMLREFPDTWVAYAVAVGVYFCGVTIYAFREEQASQPVLLAIGMLFELAAMVVIACLPLWEPGRTVEWLWPNYITYYVLVGLLGLTVLNRAVAGVVHPVPRKIQLAVRHAILSTIVIDAAAVAMFHGYQYGIGVALLLLPAVLGAMRIRTT